MYRQHLYNMADALIKNRVIDLSQREGAIKAMAEEWSDKMAYSFSVSDIQRIAREDMGGMILEDFEAKHILNYLRGQYAADINLDLTSHQIEIALDNCTW